MGSDGALLGLIVKFLGLLLQLVEATLGIEVDGILSDLALYKAHISTPSRTPGSRRMVQGSAKALSERRTMLNLCLTVCGAYGESQSSSGARRKSPSLPTRTTLFVSPFQLMVGYAW
jgi:predicted naringenin-chalcone synthase